MTKKIDTQKILKSHFLKKKKSSKGFSLRRLTELTGTSQAFLSRVLNGEKAVPYALLLKLIKALDVEPELAVELKNAHQDRVTDDAAPRRGRATTESPLASYEPMSNQDFSILREWYYLPILDYHTLVNFDDRAETLAHRLGLDLPIVKSALAKLLSLGLLKKEGDRLVKSNLHLRWASSVSRDEVRKFHEEILKKAIQELHHFSSERDFKNRLITSFTLGVPRSQIEAAKARLSKCLHEIAQELAGDPGEEIYALALQFFPLTK